MEDHHGDALVPSPQRFGQYTRSLMKVLGVPVANRYGLRPARVKGSHKLEPLSIARDLDTKRRLEGVTTFNSHMHLPHFKVTTPGSKDIHVPARQPIDLTRPHPFTEAGNEQFNMFPRAPVKMGPGDVLLADSTIFSTLFGRDWSL